MKNKLIVTGLICTFILGGLAFYNSYKTPPAPHFYAKPFLDDKVQELASRYSNGDVIVVSKKDHLLYYCHKGLIVRGDRFGGFVFNFPVPVSLGVNNKWTPEGKFKVYV
ncbi:MAG: L,D-transpeptidase, partial [Candidatus Margulisiibacteriota bacterium]